MEGCFLKVRGRIELSVVSHDEGIHVQQVTQPPGYSLGLGFVCKPTDLDTVSCTFRQLDHHDPAIRVTAL